MPRQCSEPEPDVTLLRPGEDFCYHWVALQRLDALASSEIKRLIKDSYDMVLAKLPNKVKAQLNQKY
jgi:hypothetical protein